MSEVDLSASDKSNQGELKLDEARCKGCGLHKTACCCNQLPAYSSQLNFALLMHENESNRATTTSYLIRKILPDTQTYVWQRKEPPTTLIEQITSPDTQAWLLFPADRPELKPRSKPFQPDQSKKQFIIVPDGTWKEVRKMVRKSPWLDSLPLLSFTPSVKSIYDLRRNPDADHLCTAETVAELLKLNNEDKTANTMHQGLESFIERYKLHRQGLIG